MFTDVLEGHQLTLRVNSNVVTWIEKKKPDFARNGSLNFISLRSPGILTREFFALLASLGF